MRALLANSTGWPSCRRAAPRPVLEASHCTVTSLVVLKNCNTRTLAIASFSVVNRCPARATTATRCADESTGGSVHINLQDWVRIVPDSSPNQVVVELLLRLMAAAFSLWRRFSVGLGVVLPWSKGVPCMAHPTTLA